jgi:ankyrin repeat protein
MGNLPKASAPLDVLQNIIQNTERRFSSLPNRKGRTPLHLAAWCGTDEVVEILAEKCPEAAGVMDRTQKAPLDACFRNRSRNVFRALVKANPDQIKQRGHCGRTAASLFFRISYGCVSSPSRTRFQEKPEQETFVAKAKVILAAERVARNLSTLKFDEPLELVRAAMESSSCPFPFVRYLLEKLNDETIQDFRDQDGGTFLHLAAKTLRFRFETFFQCDRCRESVNPFKNRKQCISIGIRIVLIGE